MIGRDLATALQRLIELDQESGAVVCAICKRTGKTLMLVDNVFTCEDCAEELGDVPAGDGLR